MQKRWLFGKGDPHVRDRLVRDLRISSLVGQILANRGITDRAEAEAFLWPKLNSLHEPSRLPDMDKAVRRIRQAIESRQKITIYGDYDVDGTTGSAVLMKLFERMEYPVTTYIPHRVEEGYGLNLASVRELHAQGTQLMITVDCGSRAHEAIQFLQQAGVDVIVTDHHDPGDEIPPAFALINPKRAGSDYPFRELAGSGVAFKLAWGICQGFSNQTKVSPELRDYLLMALGYVALGTVADVVPLLGENRTIVRYGLTALREARSPGIRALTDLANLKGRKLRCTDVSFRLAPRLNAAGRMGHARETLELLTTEDPARAAELAQGLNRQNDERKELVEKMVQEALEQVQQQGMAQNPVIIVAREGWHIGVVGIVASRLIDALGRPSIVIGTAGGLGKGSARSIPSYHITDALRSCEDLLLSYGGHAQAAGVQIELARLDEFRHRLLQHAATTLAPEDFIPALDIDAEVLLTQLSPSLVSELEMLEPYGQDNEEPAFVATHLQVAGTPRFMGSNDTHMSFCVSQGGYSLRSLIFGRAAEFRDLIRPGVRCSMAFVPGVNEFRGESSVELRVLDLHVEE